MAVSDSKAKAQRLQNLFASQIDKMAQQEKITSKLTTVPDLEVIKTKELKDFVGNKFILTELSPKGYMIYHPTSGIFVEHSVGTPSPYLGFDGDLYYAGPNEYYYLDSTCGQYKHTIFDEFIAEENMAHNRDVCRNMVSALEANKDQQVLNYVDKNIFVTSPMGSQASNGFYYINGYTFFQN